MSDTYESITVEAEDGIALSQIIWRRFRRPMPGLAERTLRENPGLADLGPVLPCRTRFRLPIPAEGDSASPAPLLRLTGERA